ncbi:MULTISPECIES: pyridoxamine 5'-phosphate oxidase family protein [unclassified Streptomyces]|uniref:pyridoxamine 5'-phosphate oxidase family protein n=1 Tax=unclassified Streptomyces TaxID=2593676 RepID=UPI003333AC35
MSYSEITSLEELREIVGPAPRRAFDKASATLRDVDRQWLSASPFCLVATAAADGTCDVSPRGDPPGFAHVVDDSTLAIPDRPGNRRVDSWRNVLANPRVGLAFVIPGRPDTLRINGRAKLLRDAPFFDRMTVRGNRPRIALLVEVEEVYFHCGKSFLRARLWDPAGWAPDAVPSRARITHSTEWTDMSLEQLEQRYGPEYERRLYPQRPDSA